MAGLKRDQAQQAEVQLMDSYGQKHWFEVLTRPIASADEEIVGSVGIARDITGRKVFEQEREVFLQQAAAALRRAEALYQVTEALNQTHKKADILITIVEHAASVLPAYRTILIQVDMATQTVVRQIEGGHGALHVPALSFAELMEGLSGVVLRDGQSVRSLNGHIDIRESSAVQRRRVLDHAGSILVVPIHSQGTIFGTLTAINALHGPDFTTDDLELMSTLANNAAIAIERAALLAELEHQATVDMLTQLLNRRAWFEQSRRSVALAERSRWPVSIMVLDVDYFKQINDTYGHPIGDRVLQSISQTLQHTVRSSDIIGRYGGEEFVVLLPETDAVTALVVAERIREAIARQHIVIQHQHNQRLATTISIGIVTTQGQAMNLTSLLTHADQALYTAKDAGRNCIRTLQV